MDFNMKAELVSTVIVVLVLYNVVGSMIAKTIYHFKDETKTKVDNKIWSVMDVGLRKVKEGLDYLMGNIKH